MRLALPLLPFRTIRTWVDGARPRTASPDGDPRAIRRAMQRAQRTLPGSTCLARALAAERLLRAGGHEATLTIGVARDASGALPLDAHAWVESGGLVVAGDGELDRYTRLVRFESGA